MHELARRYLGKNILVITGDVTEDTLNYLSEAMGSLLMEGIESGKYPELTLIISTHGGGCSHQIYDLLNLYPGKIIGLVINFAQSSGAIILQACDVRMATPGSKILVHHGNVCQMPIDYIMKEDKTDLEKFLAHWVHREEMNYKILSSRAGRTREEVQKLCFEDRNLSTTEAIELGLLDKVWEGPLPIDVNGVNWPKD